MKSIRILITALLLAGGVAANAQNYVYKYTTYCFEKEKASGSTKALAFNTHQKTFFFLTPKGDKSKVENAALKYFKKMKSLKDADYQTMGEIRFSNADASIAFEEEATKKLKNKFSVLNGKIVFYDVDSGRMAYMSGGTSTYSIEIDTKVVQGLGQNESLDTFINRKTNGRYNSEAEFDKAYKAKEPDALKYAEKMKLKK